VHLGLVPGDISQDVARRLEIELKYEGYIERQSREAGQFKRMEKAILRQDLDYDAVAGLSRELRDKLKAIRPANLGQASRIPGITPAAIGALMVKLRQR
jgi:tRNA uridine 5-carboxymethylaminomethyl modification enzyme